MVKNSSFRHENNIARLFENINTLNQFVPSVVCNSMLLKDKNILNNDNTSPRYCLSSYSRINLPEKIILTLSAIRCFVKRLITIYSEMQ